MAQDHDRELSKLELLQEQVLLGQLNRRSVLERAMLLGLSAPVIAGLLAACGGDDDDDDDDDDATATTAAARPARPPPRLAATEPAADATEPLPTDRTHWRCHTSRTDGASRRHGDHADVDSSTRPWPWRRRPAAHPLLAGPDHPEPALLAGHQGLGRRQPRARTADRRRRRGHAVASPGGRNPSPGERLASRKTA